MSYRPKPFFDVSDDVAREIYADNPVLPLYKQYAEWAYFRLPVDCASEGSEPVARCPDREPFRSKNGPFPDGRARFGLLWLADVLCFICGRFWQLRPCPTR